MNVLAVVHGASCPPGTFGAELERRGHTVDTWSLAFGTPPPRPVDAYDAVLLFGGAMHADQDDLHPWLREETLFVQRLLHSGTPLLGVCLGAQLIARAAHAAVLPLATPEVGWVEVSLTDAAGDDPVLGALPERFDAFQWHLYQFEVPAGAHLLAQSDLCAQAFRLGEAAWGVEFHPEVTREIVATWVAEAPLELPGTPEDFLAEFDRRADGWSELGATLCGAFCDAAARVAVAS